MRINLIKLFTKMANKEKSNIFDAITIQKGMLEISGVWPRRNPTFLYKLRNVTVTSFMIIFFATCFWEMHKYVTEKDYKHLTELSSFLASGTCLIPKQFIFMYHSERFLNLLDMLKDKNLKSYPMKLDKHVRTTNKYMRLLMRSYQFVCSCLVFSCFVTPFVTSQRTAVRFTVYDFGKWTYLYHVYQCFGIFWGAWNNTTLDVLALGLISIGTAQLEVIRDKLQNIRKWAGYTYEEVDNGNKNVSQDISDEIDEKVAERIKECVQHHEAILRYLHGIEHLFSYYFLVQFFNSVLAICNTWFQFQFTDEFGKYVYLICYSLALAMQLGIYCLYGDNLMLRSLEVREACYYSEWYNCGPKVRKSLMIIMERTSRPICLTAGKFMFLNIAAYSSLMRSSYSYFALMNQLNETN